MYNQSIIQQAEEIRTIAQTALRKGEGDKNKLITAINAAHDVLEMPIQENLEHLKGRYKNAMIEAMLLEPDSENSITYQVSDYYLDLLETVETIHN